MSTPLRFDRSIVYIIISDTNSLHYIIMNIMNIMKYIKIYIESQNRNISLNHRNDARIIIYIIRLGMRSI